MKIKISEKEKSNEPIKIKVGVVNDFETLNKIIVKIKNDLEKNVPKNSNSIKVIVSDNELEEENIEVPNLIKININSKEVKEEEGPSLEPPIKVKVDDNNLLTKEEPEKVIKLVARRALNGDVLIFDHKDIDIVLKMNDAKVTAFPKEQTEESTAYETQLRLFDYLARKGVIEKKSIQGGPAFMSMESELMSSDDYDVPQIVLATLANWIELERPYFEWVEKWEEEQERQLLEPEEGEFTEFNPDEYHDEQKGANRPGMHPYGSFYGGFYGY